MNAAAKSWIELFPALSALPSPARERLTREARVVPMAAGARIFGPGQTPGNYLLLTSGTVLVRQVSEGGREIVLYRVAAGESCTMTTACLFAHESYQAEGIAETDLEAVAIPRAAFDDLIGTCDVFRRFVFQAFGGRITQLFKVIEEVAFQRLDIRLAQRLLDRSSPEGQVAMTHQQLAAELGTAREVVSRQVHELQRRGLIAAGRGHLEIRDRRALQTLADQH
jgi:CRP/FNR family transcriptional regulator, anaerobic regulatory protein